MGKRQQRRKPKARQKQRQTRALESPPPLASFPPVAPSANSSNESFNEDATTVSSASVNTGDHRWTNAAAMTVEENPPAMTESSISSNEIIEMEDHSASSTMTELCRINGDEPEADKQLQSPTATPVVVNWDGLPVFERILVLLMSQIVPQEKRSEVAEWIETERTLYHDVINMLRRVMHRGVNQAHRRMEEDPDYEFDEKPIIYKAIEDTCWHFQDRFDQVYYEGNQGAFLHACPVVGLTDEEWLEVYQKTEDACTPRRKFVLDSEEVREELEEICSTCWECECRHPDGGTMELMVCSKCNIPRYCSHECQAKAWVSGHKTNCRDLQYTHRIMRETLATTNRVAVMRAVQENLHTHPLYDFLFSAMVMNPEVHGPRGFHTQFKQPIEGPSMVFYYQNLAAIHRGDWWIYTDACTEEDFEGVFASKEDALAAMRETGELSSIEYVAWIQLFLCYDLQGAIDKARQDREDHDDAGSAATAAANEEFMNDISALSMSCRLDSSSHRILDSSSSSQRASTLRMTAPSPLRMESPTTVRRVSHHDASTNVRCDYEMDSAVVEALLIPNAWPNLYRNFYGVSMPPECLLKAVTLDEPHDCCLEHVKTFRDYVKWGVFRDLQNAHHKG